ncbi:sugar transferase [Enterovibrio norvegicus FF-33]|nr:sugar transferase [Enterovibrio norvegicus FF-33]
MNLIMNLNANVNSDINPITAKAKRGFDIFFALIGLGLTLPLFPLIALAIKIDSRGPVFFSQMRIGRALPDRSLIFEMLKFRTMRTDAESVSGATWATKTDPRVTRIGRFLRKTRLDEIPQFINVLVGDMSLIGPRPERPGFYQKLENAIPYFAERTYGVTPGITGLAQVNQGYDTCIDDVRSKVGYDHSYALALSSPITWFKMDCYIMVRTIVVMVCGRGQ